MSLARDLNPDPMVYNFEWGGNKNNDFRQPTSTQRYDLLDQLINFFDPSVFGVARLFSMFCKRDSADRLRLSGLQLCLTKQGFLNNVSTVTEKLLAVCHPNSEFVSLSQFAIILRRLRLAALCIFMDKDTV